MQRYVGLFMGFMLVSLWGTPSTVSATDDIATFAEEAAQVYQSYTNAEHARTEVRTQQTPVSPGVSVSSECYYYELRHKEEQNELIEVAMLCILAFFSLFVVLYFLRNTRGFNADTIVNVTGLIFIIQGTIILVQMAKTDEQLTAAIGILGAVAGYLFGTMRRGESRPPGSGSE